MESLDGFGKELIETLWNVNVDNGRGTEDRKLN